MTIRSTRVAVNTHASSTHFLNPPGSLQRPISCITHFFSMMPLSSISSTGSITSPLPMSPLKVSNLWYKNLVSFPGKDLGGFNSNWSVSSKTIPASVVLDTTNLRVSISASPMYLSYSL